MGSICDRLVPCRCFPVARELTYIWQMWFSGSHSDVGGGFQDHDLSDLALVWMVVSTCFHDDGLYKAVLTVIHRPK